jgi:large subunit ribosomal protein L2
MLKSFKGTSSGIRHKIISNRKILDNNFLVRALMFGAKQKAGRNNQGTITCFHRGGGVKKKHRIIDFYRRSISSSSVVIGLEYDPLRTSFLALILSNTGVLSYILAAEGLKKYQTLTDNVSLGSSFLLSSVLVGQKIFNLESSVGKGGKIARSAGTFCKVLQKSSNCVLLKYPSGDIKVSLFSYFCTLGVVSNTSFKKTILGSAGTARRRGIRPTVRGAAMNPVDHPHGGRTVGGRPSVSPWGFLTKYPPSRKKKSYKMF